MVQVPVADLGIDGRGATGGVERHTASQRARLRLSQQMVFYTTIVQI